MVDTRNISDIANLASITRLLLLKRQLFRDVKQMKKTTEDFELIKEGAIDPELGKEVKFLILQTEQFVVYVDANLEIQWYSKDMPTDKGFGIVLNRVAYLESSARFITDDNSRLSIKRQIAEGIARYLEYSSHELSKEIHDLVESQIKEMNIKTSWGWYFDAAYLITLACLVLWGLMWIGRDDVMPYLGKVGFEVILGGLIGAVGAIISIVSRGNKINLDANAGKAIHTTEGTARIVVGIAGATLVTLAYKGGILFSGVTFLGSPFAVLLTLAIIAGASERLVPNLIAKVESGHVQNKT